MTQIDEEVVETLIDTYTDEGVASWLRNWLLADQPTRDRIVGALMHT